MAKGSGKKKAAPKPEKEEVKKPEVLGSDNAAPSDEVKADAEVAKGGNSIKATGRCEVVQIAAGKFRLFNEHGQAISPVVGAEDIDEGTGRKALSKLQRDCARMNALQRSRVIRTPAGHKDVE